MSRLGTYDLVNGFVPYDDCQQEEPKMTNADRIRSLSDEELAEWLGNMIYPECVCCPADDQGWCSDCESKWIAWLKEEVEGDNDENQT